MIRRALLLFSLLLVACDQQPPSDLSAATAPASTPAVLPSAMAGGPPYLYPHNLVGRSPAEVSLAAQAEAERSYNAPISSTEVLVARSITPEDMPALGFYCHTFWTIETPPLMLIVLRGDFDGSRYMDNSQGFGVHHRYLAYIYDIWAGLPTETFATQGGALHKVLNDPSITGDYAGQFAAQDSIPPCPTEGPKTLHYGQQVRGGLPGTPGPSIPTPDVPTPLPSAPASTVSPGGTPPNPLPTSAP